MEFNWCSAAEDPWFWFVAIGFSVYLILTVIYLGYCLGKLLKGDD